MQVHTCTRVRARTHTHTHTHPESVYFCSQETYKCLKLVDTALLNSLTVYNRISSFTILTFCKKCTLWFTVTIHIPFHSIPLHSSCCYWYLSCMLTTREFVCEYYITPYLLNYKATLDNKIHPSQSSTIWKTPAQNIFQMTK